jgi:hypothetical protein
LSCKLAANICLAIKNYPRKIETKFLQVSLTSQIKAWFQLNKTGDKKSL